LILYRIIDRWDNMRRYSSFLEYEILNHTIEYINTWNLCFSKNFSFQSRTFPYGGDTILKMGSDKASNWRKVGGGEAELD
jgi:hypothetical protein